MSAASSRPSAPRVLEGRVALVTGGGSGLGRASAVALAAAGAAVMVADLDVDAARETCAVIGGTGARAGFAGVDVADESSCAALVAAVEAEFGALHVLHNSAGVSWPGRDGFTPEIDPSSWDAVIGINLSGTFYCSHHAIPLMARSGGGSIVNMASSMATLPLGGLDAYAASKGGVALLTKSMAVGCGPLGIRANALGPGYVDTPMTELIWGVEALRSGFERGHATGMQTPEEIADLVVFLASDASRSLTGALLTCDRGWTAFKAPDVLRGA